MQVAMTERDKKLIVMLSIIVIVVAIGYWGIRPALKGMKEAKEEIELQEEIREMNDMKLAQIPLLEIYMNDNNEEIEGLKDSFYPMMNSDQIDKLFTGMVLERNLFAYDLDIKIDSEPIEMAPYQYSQMALDPFYDSEGTMDMDSAGSNPEMYGSQAGPVDSESTTYYEDTDTNYNTSVYSAEVSLRLGGSKEELMKLIDELADSEQALLIKSYSWMESSVVEQGNGSDLTGNDIDGTQTEMTADGEFTVVNRVVLNLTLSIYMYQE